MGEINEKAELSEQQPADDAPEGAVIEPEGDDLHLGAQAHLDIGSDKNKSKFGRPMSPDEGEDIHG